MASTEELGLQVAPWVDLRVTERAGKRSAPRLTIGRRGPDNREGWTLTVGSDWQRANPGYRDWVLARRVASLLVPTSHIGILLSRLMLLAGLLLMALGHGSGETLMSLHGTTSWWWWQLDQFFDGQMARVGLLLVSLGFLTLQWIARQREHLIDAVTATWGHPITAEIQAHLAWAERWSPTRCPLLWPLRATPPPTRRWPIPAVVGDAAAAAANLARWVPAQLRRTRRVDRIVVVVLGVVVAAQGTMLLVMVATGTVTVGLALAYGLSLGVAALGFSAHYVFIPAWNGLAHRHHHQLAMREGTR